MNRFTAVSYTHLDVYKRQAARNVWQNTDSIGCRFYLTRAWFRKIQDVGLSPKYASGQSEIDKR